MALPVPHLKNHIYRHNLHLCLDRNQSLGDSQKGVNVKHKLSNRIRFRSFCHNKKRSLLYGPTSWVFCFVFLFLSPCFHSGYGSLRAKLNCRFGSFLEYEILQAAHNALFNIAAGEIVVVLISEELEKKHSFSALYFRFVYALYNESVSTFEAFFKKTKPRAQQSFICVYIFNPPKSVTFAQGMQQGKKYIYEFPPPPLFA